MTQSFLYTLREAPEASQFSGPTLAKTWVGQIVGMEISKETGEKVAGSGWVSQGVSPGDMIGTTFSSVSQDPGYTL